MPNSIVILNTSDIDAALRLLQGDPDASVLVFDPTLLDRLASVNCAKVEYIEWPGAPSYRQRSDEAHRLSRELAGSLDQVVEPLWPGLHLGSWQHLSLYYLHMALTWYSGQFAALVPALADRRLLLPMCDVPMSYYFPSFVPGLLLAQPAQRQGIAIQVYTYGGRNALPQAVPELRDPRAPDGRPFLLTHLPTCFYDKDHVNAEIRASGKPVVDLQSRYWHVPVEAEVSVPTAPLETMLETLDAATRERIESVAAVLREPVERHLARWLHSTPFLARQATQLVAVFHAQLVTLALLEKHFEASRPQRLLLSDHDTDFHGPLAAFARRHQVPMLVLPHSKTSTDLEFVARNATTVFHAIQGDAVYDVCGDRPAQTVVDLPCELRFTTPGPEPVRRVGLVLNGVSLNGVPGVDLAGYAAGIKRIVDWAAGLGVELLVRSRPGQTMLRSALEPAGLTPAQMIASAEGTMPEFAQRCDLALMYDAPTSGGLEFLCRGIPLLNPVSSTLTKRETATMSSAIVPRADVETTLHYASTLVGDPLEWQRFRKRQFHDFVERLYDAPALRSLL